jgi:hypothetical protein
VGVGLLGGGVLGGGVLRGGVLRDGLADGVRLGRALVGAVRDGLGVGLADVVPVPGVEEGSTGRCGVTWVGGGAGEVERLGEGVGETGGASQVSAGSTNGMIVSGRTGPPAKLMPTIMVYATPARPRAYAVRRNHRLRRPLGSTKTGDGSGATGMICVGPSTCASLNVKSSRFLAQVSHLTCENRRNQP